MQLNKVNKGAGQGLTCPAPSDYCAAFGVYVLVFQTTLHQLASLRIEHRDLLLARMQITPYNLHVLGSFPPILGCLSTPSLLGVLRADTVISQP